MGKSLFIAEKPSVAMEFSKALKENIDLEKQLGEKQETLDALQDKINELSRTPAETGKATFAAYFEVAKDAVNGMVQAVGKMEDKDEQEKYKAAMVKMMEAMIAAVREG